MQPQSAQLDPPLPLPLRPAFTLARMASALALALAMAPWAAALGRDGGADTPTPLRIAGPAPLEEAMRALASESGHGDGFDYLRADTPLAAAVMLLSGRADVMVLEGRVTERDLVNVLARWRDLAPGERLVAARALAIAVHRRNPVESLSVAQLQSIFTGRIAQWNVIGGPAGADPIRRYGLSPTDPLTALLRDKALGPGGRAAPVVRRPTSADALAALGADPQGIAYVNAVAAALAGDAVRIVPIRAGGAPALPNAQSVKDGAYALAEPLMLYVPQAAPWTARAFEEFVASGRGDAIFRRHGFLPALREVGASDAVASFETLYGDHIRRVMATPDPFDDIALAHQIVQSARALPHDVWLLIAMCEAAFDLAASAAEAGGGGRGYATAFEALWVLAERVPEKRFDAALKRASLYERVFEKGQSRLDGEHLIEALTAAGDSGTAARRHEEASGAWQRALDIAERIDSPRFPVVAQRMRAFRARGESQRQAQTLEAALKENPQNAAARLDLLTLYLIELDDAAEAARFLDAAADETLKTNVPLAIAPVKNFSADAALRLAEWYAGLSMRAGIGGAELMTARARFYYRTFFELHPQRADDLAMRAEMGLRRIGGEMPLGDANGDATPKENEPVAGAWATLGRDDEPTDLTLAELVAARPGMERLTRHTIGSARHVTDLSPLTRLTALAALELRDARSVNDLSPLAELPNLTSLSLTGLAVDDISVLSRLFRLTSLNIANSRNVTDLTPLSRLSNLSSLYLSGCSSIADLTPLKALSRSLTSLNLSGCSGITNTQPLEELTRLRTLDLRRCRIEPDRIERLKRQLPECNVRTP